MLGSLPPVFCLPDLHCLYQQLMTMRAIDHPPARWNQTQKSIFLPVKASNKRKAMLPLKLSRLQRPLSSWLRVQMLRFWLSSPSMILACQPKKKQTFPRNLQRNLLNSLSFSMIKKHLSTHAKKQLELNGKPFPDSHFPDLLRSLSKRNQSTNFTALAEFESMFRQLNASSSLVSLKDAVTALSKP